MMLSAARTVGLFASRTAKIILGLALAQAIAPMFTPGITAGPQESSKQKTGGTSKTQKLANPLNELLDEARRDIDKSEFEAAITPLQKVIADQPEFAYAHFQLAYVYTALKKPEEARSEYERTIALDPKMTEAYLDLGILLLDKDPAAAVAPLTKAAELLPAQSRPHFLLGVALERSGDLTAAAAAFENAVVLDPQDLDTLVHLGEAYLALNRPVNAETKFRNLLERQPQEPRALLGLARSLDSQKKGEAAGVYQKYLALQPSDTAARARLVHLFLEQQQYDAAYAEMSRTDSGKPSLELLKLRYPDRAKKMGQCHRYASPSFGPGTGRCRTSRGAWARLYTEEGLSLRRKRVAHGHTSGWQEFSLLERPQFRVLSGRRLCGHARDAGRNCKGRTTRRRDVVYPRALLR
jgi:Flp pilus assembly protein TadD